MLDCERLKYCSGEAAVPTDATWHGRRNETQVSKHLPQWSLPLVTQTHERTKARVPSSHSTLVGYLGP